MGPIEREFRHIYERIMCHTCHIYHCHLPLAITSVMGGFIVCVCVCKRIFRRRWCDTEMLSGRVYRFSDPG
jgi:hypothetical protein